MIICRIEHKVIAEGGKPIEYINTDGSQASVDIILAKNPGSIVSFFTETTRYEPATHTKVLG